MIVMRKLLLLLCLLICSRVYSQTGSRLPKTLILDTDIGPDYDDVGAMAVMHALADKGEVRPLAVISCNQNKYVVPIIDVLNTYFGRPELPTGAPKGAAAPNQGASQKWPEMLVEKYPHKINNTADAENAVSVYRKILAKQPDQSVTIVTVGFLTNLADLLDSKPDEHSQLSGLNLVRKKVSGLVSMAGNFPAGREYNIYVDSLASQKVFTEWPTEIIFSGFEIGQEIKTGLKVVANDGLKSPVKDAYQLAMSKSQEDVNGRQSWDQTAVLVGVRGVQPYFGLKRGRIIIKDGNNSWQDDPMGPHAYLTPGMPAPQLTALIEGLMMWEGKK
jgi:inosine-uridine nucleoside N-ribohydrolase